MNELVDIARARDDIFRSAAAAPRSGAGLAEASAAAAERVKRFLAALDKAPELWGWSKDRQNEYAQKLRDMLRQFSKSAAPDERIIVVMAALEKLREHPGW